MGGPNSHQDLSLGRPMGGGVVATFLPSPPESILVSACLEPLPLIWGSGPSGESGGAQVGGPNSHQNLSLGRPLGEDMMAVFL